MSLKISFIKAICELPSPPPKLSIWQQFFDRPIENINFRAALIKEGWYQIKSTISPSDFYDYFIKNPSLVNNWLHYSKTNEMFIKPRFSFCKKNKEFFSHGYGGVPCGSLCEPRTTSQDPFLPAAFYVYRLCHSIKSKEECIKQICEIPKLVIKYGSQISPGQIIDDSEYKIHRSTISLSEFQNHLIKNGNLIDEWLNYSSSMPHYFSIAVCRVSNNPIQYQYFGYQSETLVSDTPSLPIAKYIFDICNLR